MQLLQTTGLNYETERQGIDTQFWCTLKGTPTLDLGDIIMGQSEIISYVDCLRGEFIYKVNIPTAPTADCDRKFGVACAGYDSVAIFEVNGGVAKATVTNTSDSYSGTESVTFPWNPAWTGSFTLFRIKLEAGTAKFYVNGTQVASITSDNVPTKMLAPYIYDFSALPMRFKTLQVRSLQGMFFYSRTTVATPSGAEGTVVARDGSVVTEAATIKVPNLGTILVSDSSAVTAVVPGLTVA